MVDELVVAASNDEIWFSARTTQLQFAALSARCDPLVVLDSLRESRARATRGRACDIAEVRRWLRNGWSTEHLMQLSRATLSGEGLKNSLHWAFPQAYYSSFALTLAFFKCVGYTEESHAGVKKKVGAMLLEDKYPKPLCFAGTGAKPRIFHGLALDKLPTPQHWDPEDSRVVDAHIRQFVNSTRTIELTDRKNATKLKTKAGGRRKSFGPKEWERVSDAIGPTGLLSLLYRKRIKANYLDIDTFLAENLDAEQLFDDLVRIVASLNMTHEAWLLSALGRKDYESCIPAARVPFVHERFMRLMSE